MLDPCKVKPRVIPEYGVTESSCYVLSIEEARNEKHWPGRSTHAIPCHEIKLTSSARRCTARTTSEIVESCITINTSKGTKSTFRAYNKSLCLPL